MMMIIIIIVMMMMMIIISVSFLNCVHGFHDFFCVWRNLNVYLRYKNPQGVGLVVRENAGMCLAKPRYPLVI